MLVVRRRLRRHNFVFYFCLAKIKYNSIIKNKSGTLLASVVVDVRLRNNGYYYTDVKYD
jgi:hypothetical protein